MIYSREIVGVINMEFILFNLLRLLSDFIIGYLGIIIQSIVMMGVGKAIQLIQSIIKKTWPRKIKTPYGERYQSPEPVIPEQGGLLFPFIQTAEAREMLKERKRLFFTAISLLFWSCAIYILKGILENMALLVFIGAFISMGL